MAHRLKLLAVLAVFTGLPAWGASEGEFRQMLEEHWFRALTLPADARAKGGLTPELDAEGAVDGNRYEECGFHTGRDNPSWWQVDLGKPVAVGRIVIANRSTNEDRAVHLQILFSLNGQSWTKVYTHDGKVFHGGRRDTKPLEVSFDGQAARFVRVQVPDNFLHLNEVEVYPRGDEQTNVALHKPATQSSTSEWSTPPAGKNLAGRKAAQQGGGESRAQPAAITGALDLAQRTLEFVSKSKPVPVLAAELKGLQERWESQVLPADQRDAFFLRVCDLRRRIILEHPALNFEQILVNRNPPTTYSHNGDQHLGIHSRPGPGLTLLSNWKTNPQPKALLEGKLPLGATRNPDLNYDADKVVFAFCDHTSPLRKRYCLYEAALDGSSVRQLTGTLRDSFATWLDRATVVIEDNDPCYLPDGGIVFISTRSQSFGRCHGGRYNPAWVLHRCDANGDNITQLSFANENEYEPSVLNDGRIIFTRWEYTNRHEMLFHKLWWCRPDGTGVAHFYGNDTLDPMEVMEATAIPGSTKVVATAQGHHSYNTGTSVVIDVTQGENGEKPITHITPETPYSESHGWPKPHFSHPYPITEDLFLVSRANHPVPAQGQTPPVNDRAIYLVDTLGGRELIYEDPDVASVSPIPVRPRSRPPVIPSMIAPGAPDYATVYVQNVYLTRNDPANAIKPGSIKAIRVNALGVQPRASREPCSMTVHVELPKKVLGTVPVNPDGSAYFKVPANMSLQMQILDENGMAILTERSLFYLQRGEKRSCVGCHEPEGTSPLAAGHMPTSARPLDLTPPAGPQYEGGLSFMRTVQPVLDRYCISCHGLDKTEKGVDLVHDGRLTWPRPLIELMKLGEHNVGDKGWTHNAERNISRAYTYYSHGSRLPKMMLEKHGQAEVDRESFQRVVDWLDLNAQCYGDLFPNKLENRRIYDRGLEELRGYVREVFGEKLARQPERALINVAQPDESRILLAPLAKEAGGWGQIPMWKSKQDAGYVKMAELVDTCIVRNPNDNVTGWTPNLKQGGGEDWVIKDRQEYLRYLQERSKAQSKAP